MTSGRAVVIPNETVAILRDLQLFDSDTERLVFRARAGEGGATLVADDDELDELIGYVAAEANHEVDRYGLDLCTGPSRERIATREVESASDT